MKISFYFGVSKIAAACMMFAAMGTHAQMVQFTGSTNPPAGSYGSVYSYPNTVYVGDSSTGSLDVTGGGVFESTAGDASTPGFIVGNSSDADGVVHVSGGGSSLTANRTILGLQVSSPGVLDANSYSSGLLSLANGGVVTMLARGSLVYADGSQ